LRGIIVQLIFDIETIPSQKPDARELVRASLKPPGTLKKAESIAAWWAAEADAALDDAYRRQSLDGGLAGEIISIAACTATGDKWVMCRTQGEPEADLLVAFGAQVGAWIDAEAAEGAGYANFAEDPFLIAHNATFDIGFLWRRAIVNGVRLPFKVPGPMARAGQHYGDTMLAWAGYGNRVSLDALCRALGVPSPKAGGFDGSQVFDAWLAGEHERIAAYNLTDAMATLAVWERLQGGAG